VASVNQRERQRRETRQALAEHAIALFRDRGFDETTVEEIAAAAGVSKRTFFLHFPTKAAAAFPDHDERVADFVRRLGDGAMHPDPLHHLLHILLAGLGNDSPMRRTRYQLLATVAALRDEDARTDRDYEEAVARFLQQRWGTTVEARVRAHAVANAVLGVVRASLIAWSEDGIDPRPLCFEILHRMFGAPFDLPLQSVHSIAGSDGERARRATVRSARSSAAAPSP
jgi:AcrR family transcriptional regulator